MLCYLVYPHRIVVNFWFLGEDASSSFACLLGSVFEFHFGGNGREGKGL